ncbi:MAG: hypothetical protein ABSD28_16350 [Tepidisphaeraceae bacterium]|jgi:hypothetical protein
MSVSLEILASRDQLSRFEGFLSLDGQEMYRISGHDQFEPFLIALCTETDLWMYLSSTGGVTAGRFDSDHAIFPYETEDRLHRARGISGPYTLFRVTRRGKPTRLWEPFSPIHFDGPTERNLYKNPLGSRVTFEEVNHELELVFRYSWAASSKFGFVRWATLLNSRNNDVRVELLDGLLNVMPAGVPMKQQLGFSCLVDAYKRCEIDEPTGLAMYSLTSIVTDRPEAAESLTANTLWTRGLDAAILLDERAVDAFRHNSEFTAVRSLIGRRGAFLLQKNLDLLARQRVDWAIVADAARDHAAIADVRQLLREPAHEIHRRLGDDVNLSEAGLSRIVAEVDGLQVSGDRMTCARHATNTLFNAMRGGAPLHGGRFKRAEFCRFVRERNQILWHAHRHVVEKLPEQLTVRELITAMSASRVPDLLRLAYEYLPLTFSRRHGDPSRPWNRFAIRMRDDAGNPCVGYEGNWRDIFQNWEALGLAYPDLFECFIAKFLSASTVDGFNPYRVTSGGIDWEIPDPGDPWSHIGYWGDHQIIYLLRLLEWSVNFHPQRLQEMITQPIFSYANVPYRLDSYRAMARNPRQTIRLDTAEAAKIDNRVKLIGADGRLLLDDKGNVYLATLLEKLLVPLLSKMCNLVPGGGIWMNTQRPEWNDANNALAGVGLSVVTLAHVRRYIAFLLELLRPMRSQAVDVSSEVIAWAEQVFVALSSHSETLDQSTVSPENRRAFMDDLGETFEDYRHGVYARGFSGKRSAGVDQILDLLELALRYADHSLAANWRSDGLAHSYNILDLGSGDRIAYVRRLDEMLEGQVAFLSSGMLGPAEALSLCSSLFNSRLYRKDQQSFMLYPIRELTGFLQRNVVSPDAVRASPLLTALVESGDRSIVARDADGIYRFSGHFRNRTDVQHALSRLEADHRWEHLVVAQTGNVLKLFDDVFGHERFNGRSERMYAYEGIGCIYWHMVSKLLLAAQECFWIGVDAGTAPREIAALAQCYYDIRAGLGLGKTAAEYGAFPTDPYSHTPLARGARQPGMTGRVKEEIITRLGEWGLRIRAGQICFDPRLLRLCELLSEPANFSWVAVDGSRQSINLMPGMAAFTFAQVPIVYSAGASDQAVITITQAEGRTRTVHGSCLAKEDSAQIFSRTGAIARLGFEFPAKLLRADP